MLHGSCHADSFPIFRDILKIGIESVPEKLKNFQTLKRLSAREDYIEFCCFESFKTDGGSFPLWRNTVFKVNFKKSMKNRHYLLLCRCPTTFIKEPGLLHNID